jgi:hypothetical protein
MSLIDPNFRVCRKQPFISFASLPESLLRVLSRFGSAARGQPSTMAGVHIGRLFRTIYLIDYVTNAAISCRIAARAQSCGGGPCCAAGDPHRQDSAGTGQAHDSLAAVSSALALLSNAVMAISQSNTLRIICCRASLTWMRSNGG